MTLNTRAEGAIVEVPLGEGVFAYARLLVEPAVEFFDVQACEGEAPDLDVLTHSGIAFTIDVMNAAVTSGRWRRIGERALTAEERTTPIRFFKQDAITGELSIYWEEQSGVVHELPAVLDDCATLEAAAVWSAEHVEDRLRDHFAGRANKWVVSLRPR